MVMQTLSRYRWALEPFVAVVLAVAWATTVVRLGPTSVLIVVISCAAVALSRVSPLIALGIAWLASIGELSGAGYIPVERAWPGYLALAISIFGVTAHGRGVVKWFALATAVILGAASALPGVRAGFTVVRNVVTLPAAAAETISIVLLGAVLSIGLVVAWVLGFLVARQRTVVLRGDRSLLLWLAMPSSIATLPADSDSATLVRPLGAWRLAVDIVLAILYVLICALGGSSSAGIRLIVVLVFGIAVALRRLSPALALGVAWLAAIAHMLSGTAVQPSDIAVLIVLYATAAYGDKIVRWAGLGSVGVGALLAAGYLTLSNTFQFGGAVTSPAAPSAQAGSLALQFTVTLVIAISVMGVAWVLGLLVRTWQRAAESRRALGRAETEERAARAQTVVEQQRNRIARDMHDVVAHSLAVVIAQADGARYAQKTDPHAVDEALQAIASTARNALGDVRLLLGQLRHNEGSGPQPTLADLDRLVEQLAAAGLNTVRRDVGEPRELGAATQLALYRIAQEALSNAMRHGVAASGAPVDAELTLTWSQASVELRCANRSKPLEDRHADDLPHEGAGLDSGGHGIPGMRERALLVGGSMNIHATDGCFVVEARVPAPARMEPV
jgi:signal transduction histidine kinase